MASPAGSSASSSSRRSLSLTNLHGKKKSFSDNGGPDSARKLITSPLSLRLTGGERTVKRLRLSKALTIPENTSVYEACHRMAARRLDALLLTDSNALLCGILTAKDIALRVIAQELNLDETPVSTVMTKKPVFVLSETLAVEALQKMVQGKFRHLPVVQNGEVIALLDIAKCLCDAISRMERAAEKGKALDFSVENLEKRWGASFSGPNSFIDTLRERMFKPTLSTILPMSRMLRISPTDTVLSATKKMHESQASCGVVIVDNKPRGILTSKDILMRVIAQDLPPHSTLVEKVMTPNPECVNIDTPIVDALHLMHDGKFLHLPVTDRDGNVVAALDVIQITHAVIATLSQVGSTASANNDATSSLMQKFWDSAMALSPHDDDADTVSESSLKLASEGTETGRSLPYLVPGTPNLFSFKMKDKRGRLHRFICDIRNMTDLITAIIQRVGYDIDGNNLPQIMYEDEDHDKIVLASDSDLAAAVDHARAAGWKDELALKKVKFLPGAINVMASDKPGLLLHLDYSGKHNCPRGRGSCGLQHNADSWAAAYSAVAAGAAVVVGLGILTYLRRTGS